MKTKPFIIFLALILLGCSNYNFELPTALMHNQVDIDAGDDAVAVTKYDIQNIVSSFGNGSSENQSRSTFYNNYSLSTIYDSTGNPAIYVVNYDNNAGFVLVSATKDYHPILAYAEIGNYDIMNSRPYGLDMWE
ncbi:MAG: Spi family protease inhibitor [Muribaculaceae bacterium]|nr:Spi family protease inhibitor [Muribaculaceae bacterium]